MTYKEWRESLSCDEKPLMGDEQIWEAATLAERERCADGCKMLARIGGTARECAEAIRKGE